MIDGIGKGGGVPPPAGGPKGPSGPKGPDGASKPFDAGRPEATREAESAAPVTAAASAPLEQLKAGTIDVERYLDLRVDEATGHLEGLAPSQLESVRSMLRERMATDPELVDLVKQATGHVPRPVDE